MTRGLTTTFYGTLLLAVLSCAAQAAPPQPQQPKQQANQPAKPKEHTVLMHKRGYHSLKVEYKPAGKDGGWFYPKVRDRKFSVQKKYKKEKLFSSLEILGSLKERDDSYLVDAWVQLEISTSPTGGAGMDAMLARTVYPLKPGVRTQVFRSPSMSLWMTMDKDKPVPVKKPSDGKPAPAPGGKK